MAWMPPPDGIATCQGDDRQEHHGRHRCSGGHNAGQAGSSPKRRSGKNDDLDALACTEVEQDGKRFLVRSAPRPAASIALRAAGIALPLICLECIEKGGM